MITLATAQAIEKILVEECGAEALTLKDWGFVRYLMDPAPYYPLEFRFMGELGFGGKFHADHSDRGWRVTCYVEDATPARLEMVDRANARLAELLKAEQAVT